MRLFLDAMRKMANGASMGLALGALIAGAAMLARAISCAEAEPKTEV